MTSRCGDDPEFAERLIEAEEIEDDLLDEILVGGRRRREHGGSPRSTPIDRAEAARGDRRPAAACDWARGIGIDTKTRTLLKALEIGFEQMADDGRGAQGADLHRVTPDAGVPEGLPGVARLPGAGRALQRYQRRAGGHRDLRALGGGEPRHRPRLGLARGGRAHGAHRAFPGRGDDPARHRGGGRRHEPAVLLAGRQLRPARGTRSASSSASAAATATGRSTTWWSSTS